VSHPSSTVTSRAGGPRTATVGTLTARMVTGETLRIVPWPHRAGSRPLHDARSAYVERCWLPIVGPSTLLFLRFASRTFEHSPQGADIDRSELACALGLRGRPGDHAPFRRMLSRAIDFQMACIDPSGRLAVRRHLPELSARQLDRATALARDAHRLLCAAAVPANPPTEHALRLARALHLLGETACEIEAQLLRWRFPPHVASLAAATAAGDAPAPNGAHGGAADRDPRPRSAPSGAVAGGEASR
jgi:hypothetical protein